MTPRPKVVGILGGMGPEATGDLFLKIVKATPAQRDQDHLRIIVDNIPQIPDRTAAILGHGPDPSPMLEAAARRLESWGAELIVIPCNTAHYFYPAISAAVGIPVLHIMRETALAIRREQPGAQRAGVLASTGTLETGLYRDALAAQGLAEVRPGEEAQQAVMQAIYEVKAGGRDQPRRLLAAAARELVANGAELVIAGCTEVPIALGPQDLQVPYFDATLALARAAVRQAMT